MQQTFEVASTVTTRPLETQVTNATGDGELVVEHFATAKLPTKWGECRIVAFRNNRDGKEHVAIVKGDVAGQEAVHTRIHSECLTGDVFGSLKCDCGPQLDAAMKQINDLGQGIILYMRQEGRGIGLANKVAAYSLQDKGLDTVEANLHLGFDDDLRDYSIAVKMLEYLAPASVSLLTNNPRKLAAIRESSIELDERVPHKIDPNPFNEHYLATKRDKSGHLL